MAMIDREARQAAIEAAAVAACAAQDPLRSIERITDKALTAYLTALASQEGAQAGEADGPKDLPEAMMNAGYEVIQSKAVHLIMAGFCLGHAAEIYEAMERVRITHTPPAPSAQAGEVVAWQWHEGAPQKPWSEEWFIAATTYGDRVVLRALPEEYAYDFRTADDTYIKADKIKRWMQFPDSEYIAPPDDAVRAAKPEDAWPHAVAWAVSRWNAEVANRPLVNVHRRSLDDAWRQVIRHFGGDPEALCGAAHDELLAAKPIVQAGPEKHDCAPDDAVRAVEAEREACAQIVQGAETSSWSCGFSEPSPIKRMLVERDLEIAAQIRARKGGAA
ncbi:hypothetical protein ACN6KF_003008 [Labrys sp. La1]|uniref:hypothetical protein n=1 Tax=Labrys sp. La1 TaxID=3404917 RepID=UPI003EBCC984